MEKSLFTCPICAAPLERGERAYACPNGHAYDKAREGYVHLLPANKKHSKAPGDDKAMAAARSAFLGKGYYAPLRDAICELGVSLTGDRPAVLDSGCGEGYYTAGLYQALLDAGKSPVMAGIDISKFILRLAAKREKRVVPPPGGGRVDRPAAQLLLPARARRVPARAAPGRGIPLRRPLGDAPVGDEAGALCQAL